MKTGLRRKKNLNRNNPLHRSTLVLNKSWIPVNVAKTQKAFTLLAKDRAQALTPDNQVYSWSEWVEEAYPDPEDRHIRLLTAGGKRVRVPEVLILCEHNSYPRGKVNFTRRNLFYRDANTCQYCGVKLALSDITVDHVKPRMQGGISEWTNCVVSCLECNMRKGPRTPAQAGMRLQRSPVRPQWSPCYAANLRVIPMSWQRFIPNLDLTADYFDVDLVP